MDYKRDQVLELLYNIQRRPKMFIVGYPNYDKLDYFLMGYFCGLGTNHLRKAAYWFGDKHGMGGAISLAHMLTIQYPDLNEEELCSLYLSTLIEFFERENDDE